MRIRTRSAISWALLGTGVLACLAISFCAYELASFAWDEVVTYVSPYVGTPGSTGASTTSSAIPESLQPSKEATPPVLARRVVLVIVDGMRNDVSRSDMHTLVRLRTYGADMTLTAPQPSLSYPNWTTILTGARQEISGVTTNWFEGRVPVPTLMDSAETIGQSVAVVGPEDFGTLYDVVPGPNVSLRPWPKGGYLSGTLIDDALRIAKAGDYRLVVVHLPDLDEAGHEHGGASADYREVARKIDADLGRLVDGLQRDDTAFVIVADHGHIDSGGHGGWEPEAVTVPAVFAGTGVRFAAGEGRLEQVAPTVALLGGIPVPAYASDGALDGVVATTSAEAFAADNAHQVAFAGHYIDVVTEGNSPASSARLTTASVAAARRMAAEARDERLAIERSRRASLGWAALAACIAIIVSIGIASWRALVSASVGAAVYYAIYNLLFFVVHGYAWSLSAFNTETFVKAFMNGRMVEAVIAGVLGTLVAAAVYPLLREQPRGPQDAWFLSGWLALGPATVLVIQATLAAQVAWYYWWYGITITWALPNFMWAFKADLDMVQLTALGAVALVAPLVTYLVGRYHPRVARGRLTRRVGSSRT